MAREGDKRAINRAALHERALLSALENRVSAAAAIGARFSALLEARASEGAFHAAAPQRVLPLDERAFAVLRTALDGASRVLAVTNVSGERLSLHLPLTDCGFSKLLRDLLGTATPGLPAVNTEAFQLLWLRV